MILVVDGDSVADARPENWPAQLAARTGVVVVNISRHNSTTLDILTRLERAIDADPTWYVLQVGQWSSKNQDRRSFMRDVRYAVRTMHMAGVRVCLVTPPCGMPETRWTAEVVRAVAREFNTMLVDVHTLMREHGMTASWFVEVENRCHLSQEGALIVSQFFVDAAQHPYRGLFK